MGPRLSAGLEFLKAHRSDDGRWRRFPPYYTLLALLEVDHPKAVREMEYAAPRLERLLKRRSTDDRFDIRRRALAERVLARL